MSCQSKILIVEDEIIIADYIFNILNKEGYTNVKLVHKKKDAQTLLESYKPDIILLDINLNGTIAGIDLAIINLNKAKVIFLTGQYDENLMAQALATQPESYLTKPIKKADLLAAVQLANLKNQMQKICIKDGASMVYINYYDLLFVKSDNNYIDIQTTTKKHTIRQSLEKFAESYLNQDFVRVHRSYIVNKTKIQKQTSKSIFIGEIEIPYSKNYFLEF
jgi:DNA-binding LytR/AlgR family response regulator